MEGHSFISKYLTEMMGHCAVEMRGIVSERVSDRHFQEFSDRPKV